MKKLLATILALVMTLTLVPAAWADTTVGLVKHTVPFHSVGGSEVKAESVEHEKTVTKPDDPTRAGFTFAGWYTLDEDGAAANAWKFDTYTVTSDVNLYAQWKKDSSADGTTYTVKKQTDDSGKTVTVEAIYEVKGDTNVTTVTEWSDYSVIETVTTDVTKNGITTTETTETRTTTVDGKEGKSIGRTKTVKTGTTMTTVSTEDSYSEQTGYERAKDVNVQVEVNENATVENTDVILNAKVATTVDTSTLTHEMIEVSKADADKLAKAKSVQVVTDLTTLTIDKTALKTLADGVSVGGTLVLTVTEFDRGANTVTYELEAMVQHNDSNLSAGKLFQETNKNTNGTITVTVPWAAAPGFRQQVVCYYYADEDGSTRTRMGGTGYKNKTFSWDTNHFSKFVIETETETVSTGRAYIDLNGGSSATTTTVKKASSATTFDAGVGVYAVSAVLSVTGMAWVGKKKH